MKASVAIAFKGFNALLADADKNIKAELDDGDFLLIMCLRTHSNVCRHSEMKSKQWKTAVNKEAENWS